MADNDTPGESPGESTLGWNVVAALILGIAVIGGSWLVSSSLDDIKDAIQTAAPARRAPAVVPQARRGLDPNRRYTINTAGAPVRGTKTAKLTIVEVADFQ